MDPFVYSRTDDIENVSSKVDTQRMKITYLHQHFKTLSMSGGTRSFEFAKRLASNGHDVNVISAWTQSYHPPSKIQMIENFRVHWIMGVRKLASE